MSFRFYPERLESIGQRAGTVGEDLLIPIQGMDGMRITIPQLSVSCGADAQTLTLLQVKEMDLVSLLDIDNSQITLEGITEDLSGRLVALETNDGSWLFLQITASSSMVQTLDGDLSEVKEGGRFFLMAESSDEECLVIPIEADSETLIQDPAPGRLIASDFCYPVVIAITNTTTAVKFNGATVVYICR